MAIEFNCTGCGQVLRSGPERAGKKVRCPSCESIQVVPQATAVGKGADDPFAGVAEESLKPNTPPARGGSAAVFMTGVYDAVHDSNDMMAPAAARPNGARRTSAPPSPMLAPGGRPPAAPGRPAGDSSRGGGLGGGMGAGAAVADSDDTSAGNGGATGGGKKSSSSTMPRIEDVNPDALFGDLPPPGTPGRTSSGIRNPGSSAVASPVAAPAGRPVAGAKPGVARSGVQQPVARSGVQSPVTSGPGQSRAGGQGVAGADAQLELDNEDTPADPLRAIPGPATGQQGPGQGARPASQSRAGMLGAPSAQPASGRLSGGQHGNAAGAAPLMPPGGLPDLNNPASGAQTQLQLPAQPVPAQGLNLNAVLFFLGAMMILAAVIVLVVMNKSGS